MRLNSFFGAPEIPLADISNIQNDAPDIIVWAAPVMFFFVIVEILVSYFQNRKFYDRKETIGSTLVGIGNVLMSLAIKLWLLYGTIWVYNMLPWRMPLNWWTFIPCYVFFDLCSYWAHHVSHTKRIWWATHVPHHSGEFYNLSVSFRLSWVQYVKIIFFVPVLLMGFHPIILFATNQIAILFQFWVHTEYIKKLPRWVEFIFATPSNHRVHHGSQEKYINKNYGATFILWDRIFKTYQEEEEKVIYGITKNIDNKANPIHINFHEFKDIIADVKNAKGWKKKMFYLFGDPSEIALEKLKEMEKNEKPQTSNKVSPDKTRNLELVKQ